MGTNQMIEVPHMKAALQHCRSLQVAPLQAALRRKLGTGPFSSLPDWSGHIGRLGRTTL